MPAYPEPPAYINNGGSGGSGGDGGARGGGRASEGGGVFNAPFSTGGVVGGFSGDVAGFSGDGGGVVGGFNDGRGSQPNRNHYSNNNNNVATRIEPIERLSQRDCLPRQQSYPDSPRYQGAASRHHQVDGSPDRPAPPGGLYVNAPSSHLRACPGPRDPSPRHHENRLLPDPKYTNQEQREQEQLHRDRRSNDSRRYNRGNHGNRDSSQHNGNQDSHASNLSVAGQTSGGSGSDGGNAVGSREARMGGEYIASGISNIGGSGNSGYGGDISVGGGGDRGGGGGGRGGGSDRGGVIDGAVRRDRAGDQQNVDTRTPNDMDYAEPLKVTNAPERLVLCVCVSVCVC